MPQGNVAQAPLSCETQIVPAGHTFSPKAWGPMLQLALTSSTTQQPVAAQSIGSAPSIEAGHAGSAGTVIPPTPYPSANPRSFDPFAQQFPPTASTTISAMGVSAGSVGTGTHAHFVDVSAGLAGTDVPMSTRSEEEVARLRVMLARAERESQKLHALLDMEPFGARRSL